MDKSCRLGRSKLLSWRIYVVNILPHYLDTLVLYHSDLVGLQDSHSGSIEDHTPDQNLLRIMKLIKYIIATSNQFCWEAIVKKSVFTASNFEDFTRFCKIDILA